MRRLLLLLPREADAPVGWLRLADGAVAARGSALAELPPRDPAVDEQVIAVAPGDAVVLHWAALPSLAPAQTAAAARLLAAEVCASPPEATHVAIGPADGDAPRCLAVVDAVRMHDWLAACGGLDPDRIVPATLLIAPPDEGVRVWRDGGLALVRGDRVAFAAEPELAALMVGEAATEVLDHRAYEGGLEAALASAPVDLRQGAFAKARRWSLDRRRVRRLAGVIAAALVVLLLTDAAATFRHSVAADRAEMSAADAARALLPRGTVVTDPVAQVEAQLGGGTAGFAGVAGGLFAAVREGGDVEVASLLYTPDTGVTAQVASPAAADVAALQQRLTAAGFAATAGATAERDGRLVADVVVRVR